MMMENATTFLQWALPRMGYRWAGFRKPRRQILRRIRGRMYELGLSGGYEEYMRYLESNPGEWDILDRLCDVTASSGTICGIIYSQRSCVGHKTSLWPSGQPVVATGRSHTVSLSSWSSCRNRLSCIKVLRSWPAIVVPKC